MIKEKISILIFIWSAILNLFSIAYDLPGDYSAIIFWYSIILIFCIILYQIFYLKFTNAIVIVEIFIVFLLLHLIFQLGYYGLRGSDSYIDYNLLKTILNNHYFELGQSVDGWPMIHLFSAGFALTTKINPLLIAKFLPSIISSIIVLPLYLLVNTIYKNRQLSLLLCLIYGTIPTFIMMEALFIRETFTIFIMILFFYLLYTSKQKTQKNTKNYTLLYLILIPAIVFGHHLTSFMIIALLFIYVLIAQIIPYIFFKDTKKRQGLSGNINIIIIFVLILASVITYWMYHSSSVLGVFYDIYTEAFGAQTENIGTYAEQVDFGSPIVSQRGNIIFYGFFFFHILLAILLMIKFLFVKNKQKIEDVTFSIFFFFCIFYSFLALYILGSLSFPDRFLPFGWMFGLIPVVSFIAILKKNYYKKILILILFFFLLFNIYNLKPEYISGNPFQNGALAGDREYAIANSINLPQRYYGHVGVVGAIYDVQGIEQRTGGINPLSISDFQNSSEVAIIYDTMFLHDLEILEVKNRVVYSRFIEIISYKNNKNVNKICDLGEMYVIVGGR